MNRQQWAQGWCDWQGFKYGPLDPVCKVPSLIVAIVTWINSEGSRAANNPLDTEQQFSGATNYNSAGVKNYPTVQDGFTASSATLRNGYYPTILAAMESQESADIICEAVYNSVWGSKPNAAMLANVRRNYGLYSSIAVSGTPATSPTIPVPTPAPQPEDDMPLDNDWIVREAYRQLLVREVDPGGYTTWMNFLNGGGSPGEMYASIQDGEEGQSVLKSQRAAMGLPPL